MFCDKIMNFYLRLLFFLPIIILLSCSNELESDEITRIKIGDKTTMIITQYDENAVVGYAMGESTYAIDLDKNGTSDIQFFGSRSHLMGTGASHQIKVNCINEKTRLFCTQFPDSIYLSRDTTKVQIEGVWKIFYGEYEICGKKDKYDTFKSLTKIGLIRLTDNDSLKIHENFASNNFEISKSFGSYPPEIISQTKDTIIFKVTKYRNECRYFPANDTSFIGFEISDNEKLKLGWIKISIEDGHRTRILETALQK